MLSLCQHLCRRLVLRTAELLLQSAIGEGMTRRDHSDVSNQVPILNSDAWFSFNL